MRTIIGAVVIILSTSFAVEARTLYVDGATGSDSTTYANNSSSAPWRTIGRAAWGSANRSAPNANEAARAGDTVMITPGVYTTAGTASFAEPSLNPVNSGTSASPIIFQATGRVDTQIPSGRGPVYGAFGKDYIYWIGHFYVDEATARPGAGDMGPVVFVDTVGSKIDGCEIKGDLAYGATVVSTNHPGIRIEQSRAVTVRNCKVYDMSCTQCSINGSGIQVYTSGALLIESNEIHNIQGAGIWIKQLQSEGGGPQSGIEQVTIRYNLVRNVNGPGIVGQRAPMTAAAPMLIYQNVVRDDAGACIRVWYLGPDAYSARHFKIVNNTLDSCAVGIQISGGDFVPNAGHVIWNNIITNMGFVAIGKLEGTEAALSADRFDFEHNLYYSFPSFAEIPGARAFSYWQNTLRHDSNAPAGTSTTNPLFVNPGIEDFRLQAGSPARSSGIDFLDLDSDGSTTDPITKGAYVTGNETIGRTGGGSPPPPTTPSQPTALRIIRTP